MAGLEMTSILYYLSKQNIFEIFQWFFCSFNWQNIFFGLIGEKPGRIYYLPVIIACQNFQKWKKAQRIHALSKIFGPNYSKITELKQSDTYFTSSTCVSEITHNSPSLTCTPEIQKPEKITKNSCFEWIFRAKTSKIKAQQF